MLSWPVATCRGRLEEQNVLLQHLLALGGDKVQKIERPLGLL